MRPLLTACSVEVYKLRRYFVLWGTFLFILFLITMFLGQPDWPSFFERTAFLYASVYGLLGFGLVTSWTFGREYSDRTVKELLVLPISRGYLVPIGFAFTTLMLALVFGPTAIGTYLPWSVPDLHLKENGVVSFPLAGISYFLVFLIGLAGFIGMVKWLHNR